MTKQILVHKRAELSVYPNACEVTT